MDVAEFEAALDRGDVRAAIELYRGDVLPTCYDDWIVSERERLHAHYVEALTQVVSDAEGQRDFVAALQYGQRALQADPLREETYRQLMRLHAAIALTGADGIGKTRLALQVAFDVLNDYADGVWWVDLAPISQAQLVTPTVATTLKTPGVCDWSRNRGLYR